MEDELVNEIKPLALLSMTRVAKQELVDMVFGSWPGLVLMLIVGVGLIIAGFIPVAEIPGRLAYGTAFYIATVLVFHSTYYLYFRFVRIPQLLDSIVQESVFITRQLEDLYYPATEYYKLALCYQGKGYVYRADSFVHGKNSVCLYGVRPIHLPERQVGDLTTDLVSILHKPKPFPPTIMVTEPSIIGGESVLIYHAEVQSVSTDYVKNEETAFSYLRLTYRHLKELDYA